MQHRYSWNRLVHLLISMSFVVGLLLPTTVYANDKDKGKSSTPAPSQAQAKKDDDKKDAPKPQAASQTSTQSQAPKQDDKKDDKPAQSQPAKQDDKKSGDLPGGTMGKSGSNPDGGGVDKPYDAAGQKANTQTKVADTSTHSDGNNGCGQDKKLDAARESDTRHLGFDDNNGWCGKNPENVKANDDKPSPPKNDDKPAPPKNDDNDDKPVVDKPREVHVKGCFTWKDSGERFFINEHMSEKDAKDFEKSTNHVSDTMEGCKPADVAGTVDENDDKDHGKVYICHRTGSMSNPWVLIHVSLNAQGHIDHDKHDIHAEDKIFWNGLPEGFTEAMCAPPAPPAPTVETPLVKTYSFEGCVMLNNQPQKVSFPTVTENEKKALENAQLPMARCELVLGTTSENPPPSNPPPSNPPPTGDTPSQPVRMYGCFRDANGNYTHYDREFPSQAEKDAFERNNGLTVQANMPNPQDCKPPVQQINNPPADNPQPQGPPPSSPPPSNPPPANPPPANPPAEVAGIQQEGPAPTLQTTIAVAEREPFPSLTVPALQVDRVITAPETPAAPPEGVQALVSEVPAAPVVQQVVTPQQPVARPTGLLPTTGEPMVDLALLTLGFLGLTLIGFRFLRIGARRA